MDSDADPRLSIGLRIAYSITNNFAARLPVDRDEIEGAALEGLARALATYTAEAGASFETWAGHKIRWSILESIRNSDHLPRSIREQVTAEQPLAFDTRSPTSLNRTVDSLEVIDAVADQHAEDDYEEVDQRDFINRRLAQLTAAQIGVVSLFYYAELNQREIAEIFGVSESRISQIHTKALSAMLKTPASLAPSRPERRPAETKKTARQLTPPELDVVRGAAIGETNTQTAARRGVSVETVKTQWRYVMATLDARNRAHAVAIAFRQKLIV